MEHSPKKFSVLNVSVHLLDDYVAWLMDRLHNHLGTHVVTLNAEMAILAEQNNQLASIIQQAELVIPDGAGVTLYLRMRGKKQKRCPGIELAQSTIESISKLSPSFPICFYGGNPEVAKSALEYWQQKLPNLSIISQHGYLSAEEEQEWRQKLQQNQPKLILVGLGVPRQELWIDRYRSLCPQAIWIGVGGSFDIWGGQKSRAPSWLKDNNLEWLYRLYQEPWRWRRMLALPQFFWRSLLYKHKLSKIN